MSSARGKLVVIALLAALIGGAAGWVVRDRMPASADALAACKESSGMYPAWYEEAKQGCAAGSGEACDLVRTYRVLCRAAGALPPQ